MLALALVVVAYVSINRVQKVGDLVDPLTYFDEFKNNTNNLVYLDERIALSEPVCLINNEIYVSYDFTRHYVSDVVFYDEAEKVMTLTNLKEVVRLYPGEENSIHFAGITGDYALEEKDGQLYIEATLLSDLFGVEIVRGRDERLFIAYDHRIKQESAKVRKKASIRTHPRKKSTVVEVLQKGEYVMVYSEENDFVRVRSENGIIGYLPKGELKGRQTIEPYILPVVEPWEANPLGERVKLVWDQMTSNNVTDLQSAKYANVDKANVISPTWFEFSDETGALIDRGNADYVIAAHQKGLQVWPIMSHNFTKTSLTAEILSSTEKRQYVIDQIIEKAKLYGFDGINIDIENIQTETSEVWVQFMRELYPVLKAEGLIVTLDVYMPSDWSSHYEREKVAEACDYFMVMAYDQHWAGSGEVGSVSELPWVEEGIKRNLEEVPAEKLVLGVPFYTRLWQESSEGIQAPAYGMASAQDLVKTWGVTPKLDEASGQNYAQIQKDDVTYSIWLEDKSSIKKRIDLMNKYQLAGYAAWKLGFETGDIWEVLEEVN